MQFSPTTNVMGVLREAANGTAAHYTEIKTAI
jgi:hypothetical protein